MPLTPELQLFIDEALALEPGGHLHPADGFMSDPPPPGHSDWLPILDLIVDELLATGDHWYVDFVLGKTDAFMKPPETLEELFAIADPTELGEPPSVGRIRSYVWPNLWEGERADYQRRVAPRVMEKFMISREVGNRKAGPPYDFFDVRVQWELNGTERRQG